MMNIKTICTFLLVIYGMQAEAQLADMKALAKKMRTQRLDYKATYNMYDAYTGGSLLESQQMDVTMWDGLLNLKTRLFHVIRNKQQYLYVDLGRKTILLNKVANYKDEMKQAEKLNALVNLDSLFSGNTVPKLLHEKGDERTYRFHYPAGSKYAYSDLTFNYKTYTLSKMVMYYNRSLSELLGKHSDMASGRKPRIEVVFNQFTYLLKTDENKFTVSPYLARKGGKYKPLPVYAGYQFIDQTLTH